MLMNFGLAWLNCPIFLSANMISLQDLYKGQLLNMPYMLIFLNKVKSLVAKIAFIFI